MERKRADGVCAMCLAAVMLTASLSGCGGGTPAASQTAGTTKAVTSTEASTEQPTESVRTESETSGSEGSDATGQPPAPHKSTKSGGAATTAAKPSGHAKSEAIYAPIKGKTVRITAYLEPTEAQKLMVKAFEKRYGCTAKWEVYNWKEWVETLARLVASGDTPDTTTVNDGDFYNSVVKKLLQPIDPYLDISDTIWHKGAMDNYRWKGQYYVACHGIDPGMIVYNKTLFENYGEKEPLQYYNEGTWTFDTFRKVAKRMTMDTTGNGQTDIYGFFGWERENFLLANGGSFVKATKDGKLALTATKPNELAGLQMVQDLMKDGSYCWGIPNDLQNFLKGKIAMVAGRVWTINSSLNLYDNMKDEIGLAPFPKGPDVKKETTPAENSGTGILASAKNPLGGMAWAHFSAVYQEEHKNDPEELKARRAWLSEEHETFINRWVKTVDVSTTMVYGIGSWYEKTLPFWEDIMYNNVSPAAAIEKHKNEMAYEINQLTKA